MTQASAIAAVDAVPPGAWAVGVSGGADSVAMLALLRARHDLRLHVVHLDHETRGGASAADAKFVADLAAAWGLAVTMARRSEVESTDRALESNLSARYRAARLKLFRRVVEAERLQGVILAHHADDQAETVLQRLLRGSGPGGLCGMSAETIIGGLVILRPLLRVGRESLRAMLAERGIEWRDDASNSSDQQQRNRLRPLVQSDPPMRQSLLELADACRAMMNWARSNAPVLAESFDVSMLRDLPAPLARESARRWLSERGSANEITPAAVERLLQMASDAASPSRRHFPGRVLVWRKGGVISAAKETSSSPQNAAGG